MKVTKAMKNSQDEIVVTGGKGRRRFIRAGAAFFISGAAVAQEGGGVQRTDCDSRGFAGEKNQSVAGNDSDSGETADRPGCGTKTPPAITRYNKQSDPVRVKRIKA